MSTEPRRNETGKAPGPLGEAAEFGRELAERLEHEWDDPIVLADLFRQTAHQGEMVASLRNTLQATLLRRTIAAARAGCDFYASSSAYESWNDVAPGDPPDLTCWPALRREDVAGDSSGFLSRNHVLHSISHTSGTTGIPLEVRRSVQEVEFLGVYFRRLFAPVVQGMRVRPLTLSFPNVYHGSPLPLPGIGFGFVSGVTDDTLIEDALGLLRRTHSIPGHGERISFLTGLIHHVTFFTSYILEQGIDPASLGLNAINITGGYLSTHWRNFLRESWKAMVNDRFSLTEMVGGASRCESCECFHLDPILVGEVLDVEAFEPVREGPGLLALTSLTPFVQMQPMIRYLTGDLVRRVESSCPTGLSFEFLGKAKNCIREEDQWLVFSAPLDEILAGMPDLTIYEWFSNVRAAHDRTVGSRPLYSLRWEDGGEGKPPRLEIRLELKYAPHCYPNRIEELERTIVARLEEVPGTALGRRRAAGTLAVRIVFLGPGQLGDPLVIKV